MKYKTLTKDHTFNNNNHRNKFMKEKYLNYKSHKVIFIKVTIKVLTNEVRSKKVKIPEHNSKEIES